MADQTSRKRSLRSAAASTKKAKKPRKNAKQTSKQTSGATSDQEIEELVSNEAREAQVDMAWEADKSVDGFDQHEARDEEAEELWEEEVERVAKYSEETTKRTNNYWKIVEKRWGQDIAKRLTRLGTGHHFSRALVQLIKKLKWLPAGTAIRRANRYAFERITNIKQGSRGGVRTTPKDFKAAIHKPAKDTKLTEEELAGIGAKLDSYGLVVPIDEEEEAPLRQDPTGLEALGGFNEPSLPNYIEPQEDRRHTAAHQLLQLQCGKSVRTFFAERQELLDIINADPDMEWFWVRMAVEKLRPELRAEAQRTLGYDESLEQLQELASQLEQIRQQEGQEQPQVLDDEEFEEVLNEPTVRKASPSASGLTSPPASPTTSNPPSAAPATSNSTPCNPPTSQSTTQAPGQSGPLGPLPSPCRPCFDRWMSVNPSHPLYDLPDCVFSSKRDRCCDKCAEAHVI
jgi:hypothetical protein